MIKTIFFIIFFSLEMTLNILLCGSLFNLPISVNIQAVLVLVVAILLAFKTFYFMELFHELGLF